jgi:hypothetical protein
MLAVPGAANGYQCTSNDVRVASVAITKVNGQTSPPFTCNEGEVITVDFNALFTNGASSERYDESIIWRVNGNSADSAKSTDIDCSFTYFIPQAPAVTVGFPGIDTDGCGDLPGQTTKTASVCGLTVTCEDPSGQGGNNPTVKVPACLNWKAPGNTNTVCNPPNPLTDTTQLTQFLPNPNSKCFCSLTDFPITIIRCQLAATCKLTDQTRKCKGQIPGATTTIEDVFGITSNPTCGGLVMTSTDANNGGSGCTTSPFILTRTYTLNDNNDRTAPVICTQKFTVIDDVPPDIAPAPVPASYQCAKDVPAAETLGATDNCPGTVSVTSSDSVHVPDSTAPTGCENKFSFVRTWTAADSCGNTDSTSQTITVSDTQGPTISCGSDEAIDICTQPVPTAPTATVVDNCDTGLTAAQTCCFSGTGVKRTYTASDKCGNPATPCVQKVTFGQICV